MTQPPLPAPRPSLTIHRQYIKDLSFESPRLQLYNATDLPTHEPVSLGLAIAQLSTDRFEVALLIRAEAHKNEIVGYVFELAYAGLFDLKDFPPDHRDATLHIEAPELLFPSARKILTNLLGINGFPYRLGAHFDFVGRYADELARRG